MIRIYSQIDLYNVLKYYQQFSNNESPTLLEHDYRLLLDFMTYPHKKDANPFSELDNAFELQNIPVRVDQLKDATIFPYEKTEIETRQAIIINQNKILTQIDTISFNSLYYLFHDEEEKQKVLSKLK